MTSTEKDISETRPERALKRLLLALSSDPALLAPNDAAHDEIVATNVVAKAAVIAARVSQAGGIIAGAGHNFLVVVPDKTEADELYEALRIFLGDNARLLEPWDILPFEPASLEPSAAGSRVETLVALAGGHFANLQQRNSMMSGVTLPICKPTTPKLGTLQIGRVTPVQSVANLQSAPLVCEPIVCVASVRAIARRTLAAPHWQNFLTRISYADEIAPARLRDILIEYGYRAAAEVSAPGEFARRGGLLDLYSPGMPAPVRIEWDGDLIESMRFFDVESQRTTGITESIAVYPPREAVLPREQDAIARAIERVEKAVKPSLRRDRFIEAMREDVFVEGLEVFQPFFSDVADVFGFPGVETILVDAPLIDERLAETFDEARREAGESDLGYDASLMWLDRLPREPDTGLPVRRAWDHPVIKGLKIHSLPKEGVAAVETEPLPLAPVDSRIIRVDLGRLVEREDKVIVVSSMPRRVADLLKEEGFEPDKVTVLAGNLLSGARLSASAISIVGDADFFGTRRRKAGRGKSRRALADWGALREGDFVVHIHHGVGIFRGIERITTLGEARDVVLIEYAGGDKLYLPPHETGFVERYTVIDGVAPKLDKLGAAGWAKIRDRAERETAEIARELLDLYAARNMTDGVRYSQQKEEHDFAKAFEYDETEDQEKAIADILRDLSKDAGRAPMDRLLCGDVGFGKTEVALRAVFRVVRHGKQVAVLCPTTILALQHSETFRDRLEPFGIATGVLSRFQSSAEIKRTLADLTAGRINVVIGTHKLLGSAVKFRDLGLVIVDEEQRFGVKHKEKLKSLRKQVDILTMTATPIPRTLHLALSGARTISLIETPPPGRSPIQTIVEPFNEEHVRNAIRRELDRDGQVFYVHNQIETIDRVHEFLRKMFPRVTMEVAHGRMDDEDLSSTMMNFLDGKTAILISTAIVENGLDIPRANTMIVDRAERFGLSALYQLRGRVGRSKTKAYAYFFHGLEATITREARARLAAIAEHTALGAGYAIAHRDMEIRGAGEILGASQSGEMEAVGYDMYCRLLREAIEELRGGKPRKQRQRPVADLILSAFVPFDWLGGEELVSAVHREIAAAETVAAVDALRESLIDRFGQPPLEVENLLQIAKLRAYAALDNVESIIESEHDVTIRWRKGSAEDRESYLMALCPPLYIQYRDNAAVIENFPKDRSKIDAIRRILRR